jgi:DHA2 family multidrug resistance protein
MVAYIDDFKLMLIITLCAIPLAMTLRRPKAMVASAAPAVHAD